MSAELKASRQDATLILTLSNLGAKNTIDAEICAAAIETLTTAERDEQIRAVVLTGADNFFCAGSNLNHILKNREHDQSVIINTIDNLHGLIEAIRDCPKPVIAAVEGAAAGAGFSLALACDMIVAGSTAQFVMSYAKVGLTTDGGASWFLTQSLPRQIATEILMEGKPIGAPRLLDLGVVNKVVADGAALNAALTWADDLAKLSPNAMERIKSLIREAESNSLAQHFEIEKQNFIESLYHRDAQEGISAFLEKRTPHYK
ncbi:MAG: oxepin-CoA hydrolase, alternative type [Burkholderiaceae bacterium]